MVPYLTRALLTLSIRLLEESTRPRVAVEQIFMSSEGEVRVAAVWIADVPGDGIECGLVRLVERRVESGESCCCQ